MNRLLRILPLLLALVAPAPLCAQRDLKNIPDPDPELERQSFQVADGFDVNLFAADPRIAKPIQMNFDARGRLWIASSSIYPHIEPGQEANDRILVVEDADGDGVAETTAVFADGLLIPTAVEPGDGGAYVANSTELVHFRDLDGDGKADVKRTLLSGFGTEDTHHILHTFRWGMDGMLYFNQSIYIHSHIETPWGVRRLGGGGIWQLRPESLKLEILCRGFVNPWGHHFDDWGQSFASDGAYGEGVNYVFPGSVWVTAPGATRIVRGLNPGSPKHCGLEVLSGTHLPEEWRGNIIANDFRGHRVCRFVISEDGSGYASREQPEVIKTDHVAFRPIDVKMGPDGAIYIADWYNPIIQHGEVDFRDPRRDHTHGRIWRITCKGRPLVPRPKLADAPIAELLDALKSPEYFTRHHAKRMLKERGAPAVLPELERWVARPGASDREIEHHRLEALWTFQSLDAVAPTLLGGLLRSKDHRARAAAVRVLSQWRERVPGALDLLGTAAADNHPRVRLEAVCALAQIPGVRSTELAFQAADHPLDQNLDFALWQAARDRQTDWLPLARKGEPIFDGNARRLIMALQAVGTSAVVDPLVRLLKAGRVPADEEETVLTTIASHGGASELRLVFDLALADSNASRTAKLLTALTYAAERRGVVPEGELSGLADLFGQHDDLDPIVCRAVGHWKLEALRPRLTEMAQTTESMTPAVQGALDGLALLGGNATRDTLTELATPNRPFPVRVQALGALATVDLPAAARLSIDLLAAAGKENSAAPIFETFWRQKDGPAEFIAALGNRRLPQDVAKIGMRTARIAGRDLGEAIAALSRAGGIPSEPQPLTPAQMEQLLADVKGRGSASRGEAIFRRADQVCLKCHAVSGAGGVVGPDLASIGASAQVDYLVDSLLLPNKAVKENYHSLVMETKAGKVITGVKVRQTDAELVLRDAEDREIKVALDDIEGQSMGGSIMPAGLIEGLTRDELIDLVRFLSELGKVGAYAPSQARLARRWQTLDPASGGVNELLRGKPAAIATQPSLTWKSVYARVSGELPLSELPPFTAPASGTMLNFVRCRIDATTAGKVGLRLNSAKGLMIWLDGKPLEPAESIEVDLARGEHHLIFRIDRRDRPDDLRLELMDVAGSPAQAQFVNGK